MNVTLTTLKSFSAALLRLSGKHVSLLKHLFKIFGRIKKHLYYLILVFFFFLLLLLLFDKLTRTVSIEFTLMFFFFVFLLAKEQVTPAQEMLNDNVYRREKSL